MKPADFREFDYILAMDESNLEDLASIAPRGAKAKGASSSPPPLPVHGRLLTATVMLFGHFDGKDRREIVEDPYYGGTAGFTTNFNQIIRLTKNFVREVLAEDVE